MTHERAPLPTAFDAPPRGRVLALAPHADDEVIGCGGTLAMHRAQGDRVTVLIAFDGALGGDPEVRRREALAAGARLGVRDYRFWNHPEGHEPDTASFSAAADELAWLLRDEPPDIVYAPWIGEHHVDHHVLSRVARAALELAHFDGLALGYEVWTPLVAERVVDVTGMWPRKLAALAEHRSQLAHNDLVHKALGLAAHRSLYLKRGARYGEAFAPLDARGRIARVRPVEAGETRGEAGESDVDRLRRAC
jgi:LmbE family N-acetylglucosaminyl deacetylase